MNSSKTLLLSISFVFFLSCFFFNAGGVLAATTRDVYVDPDASGTGDGTSWTNAYTSLFAAEAGEQGDITLATGSDEIVVIHCRSSAGTADTTAVTIDGWTTSATNYIKIVVDEADRHSGVWDESKYRLELAGNPNIAISENDVRIDGLQIYNTSTTTYRHAVDYNGSGEFQFSNNIVRAIQDYDENHGVDTDQTVSGGVIKIWNNIIYDVGRGMYLDNYNRTNTEFYIYNNTIHSSHLDGLYYKNSDAGTTFKMKNNLIQDSDLLGLSNENYWKWTEDLDNASGYWSLYGSPTVTESNGITTLAQTEIQSVYLRKLNFVDDADIDLGTNYVLLLKANQHNGTSINPYFQARVTSAVDMNDEVSAVNVIETSYANEIISYSKLLLPFRTGVSTDLFFYNDGVQANTVDIEKLQLALFPGWSGVSYGDSITNYAISYNQNTPKDRKLDTGNAYTMMYSYDKKILLENKGVSGDTLSDIYTRMVSDLETEYYPVIFIQGGTNDVNNGNISLTDMQTAMTNIITLAKTKADLVVVLNCPPNHLDKEKHSLYNSWLSTYSEAQGVTYIDTVAILGDGSGTYGTGRDYRYYGWGDSGFADATTELHPNALGHEVLSQALQTQIILPSSVLYVKDYISTQETIDEAVISNISYTTDLNSGTTETATNLSGDTSSPDILYQNLTTTFTNEAGDDFSLASSDISALDSGTSLSADTNLVFTTDIDEDTRADGNASGSFWDIGADEYININLIAPSSFSLSSPSDDSSIGDATPSFSWGASSDNDLSHYTLYVDGSVNTDNISGTSQTITSDLSCGTHTWYVKATDDVGNSTNSSAFSFVIACGGGSPGAVSVASLIGSGLVPKPRLQRIENGVVTYLDEEDEKQVKEGKESKNVENRDISEEESIVSIPSIGRVSFVQDLWLGLRSEEVKELQRVLRELGLFNYPTNTGYYGRVTEEAIQAFQCKYDVVCSGTPSTTGYGNFGPKTRAELNEVGGETTLLDSDDLSLTEQVQSVEDLQKQIEGLQKMVEELMKQLEEMS